jgi:hypothetical protein
MNEMQGVFNRAQAHGHFVQFYKADEPLLNRNVGNFLWDGLLRGDGLLVIGTRQRRECLSSHLSRLGADVALARREGQLAMLDAHEVLERFMVNGQPDWDRFQHAIGEALQLARPRVADAGICAYGEMVGVLWEAGETEAAIRLEDCWNKLLHRGGITLFCGYPIDVFANDFQRGHVHDVLCAHSHVLPTGPNGDLRDALHQAMDELLGARADEVRSSMRAGIPSLCLALPETESAILWLRSNVPDEAEGILACARSYYEASHALGAA